MNVSVSLTTTLESALADLGNTNPSPHTGVIVIKSRNMEKLFTGGGCEAYYPDGKTAPNLSICYHQKR